MVVVVSVVLYVVDASSSSVVVEICHVRFSQLKMRLELLYQTPLVTNARSTGAGIFCRAIHSVDVVCHV